MLGNNTGMEPRTKPIIAKYEILRKYLKLNLIKISKTSPPTASPIPIGTSTLKFKLDTADKYKEYFPISIKITVLLIPGTTMPADIKAPAMTNVPKEAELLCIK